MTYNKETLKEAIVQKLRLNYGCTEQQATDHDDERFTAPYSQWTSWPSTAYRPARRPPTRESVRLPTTCR